MSENKEFQLLAQYNRQANDLLYAACTDISDEDRKRDRKAFFKSIHSTLNHLLLGDIIWMTRFKGETYPPTDLGRDLYEDYSKLRKARTDKDAEIEEFMSDLPSDISDRTIAYKNNSGSDCEDPMSLLLIHFFNHQTHHRGQVHDMLCQTGIKTPALDLHRIIKPDPR